MSTCIKQYLNISILIPSLFSVTNLTFRDFLDDVGIAYKHKRFYRNHQLQVLCDHQELAYTPKDPPWRVSMTEMSFRNTYGNIYWVIDKTVWKPTLLTPFFSHALNGPRTAGIFRPLQSTSSHFRPLETTSINHFKPLLVPNPASINHFKPLQPTSNEMLEVIKGSITIYILHKEGASRSHCAEPASAFSNESSAWEVQCCTA